MIRLGKLTILGDDPKLRLEWRMLSIKTRKRYIAAVQCLAHSPSRLGLSSSRYDDFVYAHLVSSSILSKCYCNTHHISTWGGRLSSLAPVVYPAVRKCVAK
ncbi:hypothetical protein BOTNAR_0678g00040 [Botryotinia narcissicola]|uniref:Uncharacterized protein n=1 Tax=Botryotinia narcissicola TaxID=278944 RepID=A0A4Z1HAR8_9HELO|nr:hypothetical protein BOTNAR_0678g00040 [Botryotinia narcissicola]